MLVTHLAWKGPAQRNPLKKAISGLFVGIDDSFYIITAAQ
jgi:hypothetical protein